ncbi:MAG: hypothetical protein A4E70_02231 [Syntrophus sp. PtaU1.Bin005]|nr:MAG: hypothetical protein A4E70_02231 [Syntrophus sp. PtaU1.Bin005]
MRRPQDIVGSFAGQADDDVGADQQIFIGGPLYGIKKFSRRMAPVDPQQRWVGNRLQSVFQPDMSIPGVALQEIQDIVGYTVGAGSHRKADNVFLGQGLVIEALQAVAGGVGIGEGLEIGDELFCPLAVPIEFPSPPDLFADGG